MQKGPTVLGAQASSPARVPSNQQPLTDLVALDAGRQGRLRSQDRGAFLQEAIQLVVTKPTRPAAKQRVFDNLWLSWLRLDKLKHIEHYIPESSAEGP